MNSSSAPVPESVRTRRERDKRQREDDFLAAAESLFGERGFNDASMEEIAHQAGYATGTIYRYFPSKRELFGELLHRRLDAYFETVRAAVKGETTPRGRLRAMVRSKVRFFVMNQDFLRLYTAGMDPLAGAPCAATDPQSKVRQKFVDLLRQVIVDARNAGLVSSDTEDWAMAGFTGLTNAVLLVAVQSGRDLSEEELSTWLLRVIEKGLWKT